MSVRDTLRDELRGHGPEISAAILDHLPQLVEFFRSRRFDKAAVTADFERLTRSAAAEFAATRARIEADAETQARRDDVTAVHRINDTGEAG